MARKERDDTDEVKLATDDTISIDVVKNVDGLFDNAKLEQSDTYVRKIIDGLLYDTTNATRLLKKDGATYYVTQNRRFFCETNGEIEAVPVQDMGEVLSDNVELYEKYIGKVVEA